MASPSCQRCTEPVNDAEGALLQCAACGGPIEDECARCGNREVRGEELRRCIGCGDWLCSRPTCSRQGYENLARRQTGRVCATCFRKREIVIMAGSGKGAGSAAGIEAIERSRYYLHEVGEELDERLRKLTSELLRQLDETAQRHITTAGEKLGRALEDGLARGAARAAADAERSGRSLVDAAGTQLRVVRMPIIAIALLVLLANGAITIGLVMALR